MVSRRDYGVCCLVLPLKLGAGLITLFILVESVFSILALFSGEVRFQENGYFLPTFKLPAIVSAFGLFFGFFGLLGIYEDNASWTKYFNYFFAVKVVAMIVAAACDYWMLRKCESWMFSTERVTQPNPQMDALAKTGTCDMARIAYALGAGVDIGLHVYLLYCTWSFMVQARATPPYHIDFGFENYDVTGRWKLYKVKDPRGNMARGKQTTDEDYDDDDDGDENDYDAQPRIYTYGTMEKTRPGSYNADGTKAQTVFNPDGTQAEPYGAVPNTPVTGTTPGRY